MPNIALAHSKRFDFEIFLSFMLVSALYIGDTDDKRKISKLIQMASVKAKSEFFR
jgi:hypothetical protein